MEMKIVINDSKTGKSFNKTLENDKADQLFGKKIGEELELSFLGLDGYSGIITGGSYMTGMPMSKDLDGSGLRKVLIGKGLGNKQNIRRRKSIAGNTIGQFTSQINIKISKYGEKSLEQLFTPSNG
ncbi:MAG: 30S ribosomal protein S6e [Candidatus Parvarchaeota archaeon]|nr:30S ribosomal protein S6e [Candidatus Parvarchaeota archaeon]MCW1295189.1 30S ribosomal protein S6e [Candidatus Parvarchaeum tengchongense]MCW1299512.1 30S ribosomal protein S6e [Candidatus Parvarchaeum tengchongense]MCW1312275.1 30S ribosomal protein S6e [Candidatus Parvarchaeum tengchongense]